MGHARGNEAVKPVVGVLDAGALFTQRLARRLVRGKGAEVARLLDDAVGEQDGDLVRQRAGVKQPLQLRDWAGVAIGQAAQPGLGPERLSPLLG